LVGRIRSEKPAALIFVFFKVADDKIGLAYKIKKAGLNRAGFSST